jgi:hypothetical protein
MPSSLEFYSFLCSVFWAGNVVQCLALSWILALKSPVLLLFPLQDFDVANIRSWCWSFPEFCLCANESRVVDLEDLQKLSSQMLIGFQQALGMITLSRQFDHWCMAEVSRIASFVDDFVVFFFSISFHWWWLSFAFLMCFLVWWWFRGISKATTPWDLSTIGPGHGKCT